HLRPHDLAADVDLDRTCIRTDAAADLHPQPGMGAACRIDVEGVAHVEPHTATSASGAPRARQIELEDELAARGGAVGEKLVVPAPGSRAAGEDVGRRTARYRAGVER